MNTDIKTFREIVYHEFIKNAGIDLEKLNEDVKALKIDPHQMQYWIDYFKNIFPTTLKLFQAASKYQFSDGAINNRFSSFNDLKDTIVNGWVLPQLKRNFEDNPYDILISMVGYSPEPILHTIFTLKPKKIYFIMSKGMSISDLRFDYKIFLEKMIQENVLYLVDNKEDKTDLSSIINQKLECEIIPKVVNSIFPNEISEKVKEIIKDKDLSKIAMDITGGKKSINSEAFSVASLLGIDAYYVDFQEYNTTSGRPVYGTEFINLVTNPIKEFVKGVGEIFQKIADGTRIRSSDLPNLNNEVFETLIRLGLIIKDENEYMEYPFILRREVN